MASKRAGTFSQCYRKIIYHMFSHWVCYSELGELYLDKLNKHHLTRNLVHRLERLGYTVTLEQRAA